MSARIIAFPGCALPVQQPKRKGRPPKAAPSLSAAAIQRQQRQQIEGRLQNALGFIQTIETCLGYVKAAIHDAELTLNQPPTPGSVSRKEG